MPYNSSLERQISSAEMTAIYRCADPELSGDRLSTKLTSIAGMEKAKGFMNKYNYPLVNQKVSARAGYLLTEAGRLLRSGYYDSVISLASGLSLLTYQIALRNQNPKEKIIYYDTDLADSIKIRTTRIINIKDNLNQRILAKLQTKVFDINSAYEAKKHLTELFPDCKKPIFIIEGVSYFLSSNCINWLIQEISSYKQVSVLMDYWPSNILEISEKFRSAYPDISDFLPDSEQSKSFWDKQKLMLFNHAFPKTENYAISDVEQILLSNKKIKTTKLRDTNEYFPLRMLTGEKGKLTSNSFVNYGQLS